MVRFCLNGIVRNEADRIERMLESVAPFLAYVVMVDTGSTDDTKGKIERFCEAKHIPCQIFDTEFVDFSQARNAALAHARAVWCETQAFDYLMLVDADMELKVSDPQVFDGLTGPSYDIYQYAGAVHYQNRRLLKADQFGQYRGVTHEYLDVETAGCLPELAVWFLDHADGSNRVDKFKRDVRLLKEGLRAEPNNERYMFYLAQSYRDAGAPVSAAAWYKRRVAAGGWDEEVWQAQCNYAACLRSMGKYDAFVTETMKAYQMRPSRAESIYDLAKYFREKGENALAVLFAETGVAIPPSKDALFVNDMVYQTGCLEEVSIAGFYVPGKEKAGANATYKLATMQTPYGQARETARNNMFYYLKPLVEHCPSFTWRSIDWVPPVEGWTCMNPSITTMNGSLVMNMRTVNYRMDEQGRYLVRGVYDDGTLGCNANAENPINTRNWLLRVLPDLTVAGAQEIKPPVHMAIEFPLVVGFEDVRLFEWGKELHGSATVRQIARDGQCEQVRFQIEDWDSDPRIGLRFTRMLREPRVAEKNWSPWVRGSTLKFMYQPGLVVDKYGATEAIHDTGLHSIDLRGGTQIVMFRGGWLSVVHEARQLPGSAKRYYWHRFVWYDDKGALQRMSEPFVFNDRVIEFAAGMTWLDASRLVISYGFKDEEARLGTILDTDVERMLAWPVK
jgi:glycosyltransferase involved in cell wall biosynthesis